MGMDTIYNWNAKRAGGRITVYGYNANGTARRQPHVDVIKPEGNMVIAVDHEGRRFHLSMENPPQA